MSRGRSDRQAFTMVEVVMAMFILSLLVGVLYAMVSGTIRSTAALEERESRAQEISGFLALCRKTFHTLPSNAIFEVRVVPQGGNYTQELIFRNAPGMFWWGDEKNMSSSTILGLRPKLGGLTGIGILQDTEEQITSYLNGGSSAHTWLLLLPDLRNAEWRFYDPRSSNWEKIWNESAFRPAAAELTLTTENGTEKYVFWIPPSKSAQE